MLETGTNLFWQYACGMGRCCSGGFPPDDSGGRHSALPHGPVCESAEFFNCRGAVDCAFGGSAKVWAGSNLDFSGGPDPSADGFVRVGLRRAADRRPAHAAAAAAIRAGAVSDHAVSAGDGGLSASAGQPFLFLSAAMGVV